jgi:hypothetical protein
MVLDPKAARAGDGPLEKDRKQAIGSTSTLEVVMPSQEKPPAKGGGSNTPSRRPTPQAARPVPPARPPISPGAARPAPDPPAVGERRIPIRVDERAVLDANHWSRDPSHGMFDQKDPTSGMTPPGTDRLDLANPGPAPTPTRESTEKPKPIARSGWLGEHVDVDLSDGISYHTNIETQDTNLRLKIWGPVVKGHAGVGARLRGAEIGEHPVELRARATKHQQDVQIKIDF